MLYFIMQERTPTLTRVVLILAITSGFSIVCDANAQPSDAIKRVKSLDQGQRSPAATIEQMGWIAGNWQGKGLGGKTEEVWSKPFKGSIMGMFKLLREDKVEEVAFEFHSEGIAVRPTDEPNEANQSLSPRREARNMSFVATKDVVAAKQFYREKLGLEGLHEDNLAVMYRVGHNMVLRVQRMKEFTSQPFTVSGWQVDDLKSTVAKLTKQGVTFERYGFL